LAQTTPESSSFESEPVCSGVWVDRRFRLGTAFSQAMLVLEPELASLMPEFTGFNGLLDSSGVNVIKPFFLRH
jgi:hypothetical protein